MTIILRGANCSSMVSVNSIQHAVRLFIFSLLLIQQGCLLPPRDTNPMQADWKQKDPAHPADTLIVFLPGRKDEPDDFMKNGFIEAMWEAGIEADAVLPHAHLGYYFRRTFPERLMEDIIRPARGMGYENIWAVGVSLGGFGALMFERDHPGTWQGVVLIAPFPGDHNSVIKKLHEAANLQSVAFKEERTDDDYTENFWAWLQDYQKDPHFPIFLGYGEEDRMQAEQALLADVLPQDHVRTISGKHEWPVWKELWSQLLPIIPLSLQADGK